MSSKDLSRRQLSAWPADAFANKGITELDASDNELTT
jgi:hypothetical protein